MKKTVFIIEDNAQFLMLMRKKFRTNGYSVSYASDGKEALEKFASEKVDVVLLDLILPEMDGMDVLKHMTEKAGSPPVIVLTNFDDKTKKKRVKKMGADYFVKSEVEINDIVTRVEELL